MPPPSHDDRSRLKPGRRKDPFEPRSSLDEAMYSGKVVGAGYKTQKGILTTETGTRRVEEQVPYKSCDGVFVFCHGKKILVSNFNPNHTCPTSVLAPRIGTYLKPLRDSLKWKDSISGTQLRLIVLTREPDRFLYTTFAISGCAFTPSPGSLSR